jgi:hypothetical protein
MRCMMLAGPLLMLLAMVPQLAYIDHWLAPHEAEEPGSAEEEEAEHASHHDHCHLGPATCSGQPAPPNGRSFTMLVELPDPDLPTVLVQHTDDTLDEFLAPPPKRPPRAAGA